MKRILLVTSVTLLVLVAIAAPRAQQADVKSEISQAIDATYLNGYWNNMDLKALMSGWDHGAISMGIEPNNDQMAFTSLINWFSGMTQRKAPEKKEFRFLYPVIDVEGNMAMAKVEVMKGDTIQFTDYLPLFKTKAGWKLVAYPFYEHRNGERPAVAEGEAAAVKKAVEDTIVHGLIENANKEQVMAGIGEVCDINRYVAEFDEVTKQSLGMVFVGISRGAKPAPLKNQDFSLIGITGYLAAGKLTVEFVGGARPFHMYLALYKTKAGWKIVELTSDFRLDRMLVMPQKTHQSGDINAR